MYKTSDIYMNAYLLAKNFKYSDVEVEKQTTRRTVYFVYEDSEELRQAIDDYKENEFLDNYISNYLYTKREITIALKYK